MATVGIDSVSRLAGSRQIRQVFLRTIATVGQEAGGGLPCPEVSGCYRRSPRFPLNVAPPAPGFQRVLRCAWF
jgi:hypothetical protein